MVFYILIVATVFVLIYVLVVSDSYDRGLDFMITLVASAMVCFMVMVIGLSVASVAPPTETKTTNDSNKAMIIAIDTETIRFKENVNNVQQDRELSLSDVSFVSDENVKSNQDIFVNTKTEIKKFWYLAPFPMSDEKSYEIHIPENYNFGIDKNNLDEENPDVNIQEFQGIN